ncbi:MAG: hypothetical protein KME38_20540 [Spirirestis rafaelensis WJT71-NPBG6]|nr:hypothetical protein [Spirirestis rafaelensis WJT71-NPBG6]
MCVTKEYGTQTQRPTASRLTALSPLDTTYIFGFNILMRSQTPPSHQPQSI